MTFALSALEIDTLAAMADRPLASHMATPFWREADNPSISGERREALQFIGAALRFGMYFHPSNANQPYGKHAGMHSPELLTEKQAQELAALATQIKTAEVRAIFSDLAWLRIRGNPDTARLAVAAYVESARNVEDPDHWVDGIRRLERAVRLGRSLGADDPSFTVAASYASELVDKYRGEDKLFLTGEAITLLLEFQIGDIATYIKYAERAADSAILRNSFRVARYYLGLLEKLHRALKNETGLLKAQRDFARTFEAEARMKEAAGENMVAAHFFNQAIQAHRRVPNSAQFVDALRLDLQRVERASISELKRIQGDSVDVSQFTLAARQHVSGRDLRGAILRFAHVAPLANPDEVRKTVIEIGKVAPLHRIFNMSSLDSEGRTIGITPGDSPSADDNEAAIFAHIVSQLTIQRGFSVQAQILPALDQLMLEHAVTLQELNGLCAYSPFVPSGREDIFSEGLYAGFNGDFLISTHLLVPQIENSLRHLMDAQGLITTKLDKAGVQRVLDLNDLVVDGRLETILSKNVLLELRTLFTDNRGPNLRNQLAHGMLNDNAFSSAEAVYSWWLVLALCIFSKLMIATPDEPAAGQIIDPSLPVPES